MHSPHAGQPGASRGVPKSRRRRTPFVLLSYLIVRIGDRTSRGHYPHTIPVALSAHLPDVCGYKQRYSSTLAGIWLRPQAPGFAEEVSWTDRTWTQLPDMYITTRTPGFSVSKVNSVLSRGPVTAEECLRMGGTIHSSL